MKVRVKDLLHEGGKTYKKGEEFETTKERGQRLIEIGICETVDEPKEDKMVKGPEKKK